MPPLVSNDPLYAEQENLHTIRMVNASSRRMRPSSVNLKGFASGLEPKIIAFVSISERNSLSKRARKRTIKLI